MFRENAGSSHRASRHAIHIIVLFILLYHIAGMQALRIAQADLLREKQRSRDLAQEARSMHAVHGLRAPWRGQGRKAQCKGAEPLRPDTQVKMVKKVNTCNNTIVNYN